MASLPISTALAEAAPESISELYSRDVESLSDADIDRIIEGLRAHRERMEIAEAAGARLPRQPREKPEPVTAPSKVAIAGLRL